MRACVCMCACMWVCLFLCVCKRVCACVSIGKITDPWILAPRNALLQSLTWCRVQYYVGVHDMFPPRFEEIFAQCLELLLRKKSFAYDYHYRLVRRQSKGMDRYKPWRGSVQTNSTRLCETRFVETK